MLECPHCGTEIPAASRFCLECGRPLAATAPARAYPWRSIPDAVLLVAAGAAVAGIVLLAAGLTSLGILALIAAVVVAIARGLDRRRAEYALAGLRMRAAATREAMAARSRGQVELFRARRELAELETERNRLFRDLGIAVYHGDEGETNGARAAVSAIVGRIAEKEAEIETLRRNVEERVQRAQASVSPTERLEVPPDPAHVPEPWPPPDEADLPEPAPTEPGPLGPSGPDEPAPPQHPPPPQHRSRERA